MSDGLMVLAIIVFVGAATAVCITLEKGFKAIVEELSNIYGELLKRDRGKMEVTQYALESVTSNGGVLKAEDWEALVAIRPAPASDERYVGIITRYIYGTSGTELPPPVSRTERYVYINLPSESRTDFQNRIADLGIALRTAADKVKPSEYSSRDGFDWVVLDVRDAPAPAPANGGKA